MFASGLGLKETRSLSSLYERWYDPPRVCLNENIGKNTNRTIYYYVEQYTPCHLTKMRKKFHSIDSIEFYLFVADCISFIPFTVGTLVLLQYGNKN